MKIFTVHVRRHGLFPDDDIALVREGFSWGGCFFGVFWALWHRLWWEAAALLGAFVVMGLSAILIFGASSMAANIPILMMAVIVGFVANDMRRRALDADGFEEVAVVAAVGADAALHRVLDQAPDLFQAPPPAPWGQAPAAGGVAQAGGSQ